METKNKLRATEEITVLPREQHDAIRDASYKHPLGFLIRFLMYTGITVAELLVLSWRDLDIQRNHLYIPKLLIPTDSGFVKHPEVHSRYVPLLPFIREELLEWEFVQKSFCKPYELTDETGAAFATTLTGEPLWPEDIENVYHEILGMCGIPVHPIRVLRDTYAVFVLGCGLSPYSLNEIMGDPNAADFFGNYMNANCNIKLSISSVRINQVTAGCGLGEEGAVGDQRAQAGRAGQAAKILSISSSNASSGVL